MEYVLDPSPLIHFAAAFEFYVFAFTFVICICLLSLGAARFAIMTVLAHTFPDWKNGVVWLKEHWPRRGRYPKQEQRP